MPPSRLLWPSLALAACLLLLVATCGAVLTGRAQFGFRDAAQHYYPLYQRVHQEWQAGRIPLWDPWQNGGQPLLGNPTATVFYPGQLVYAALPYAWAARVYVLMHLALACAGMLVFTRGLGVSEAGATLAALAYGFSGPILFQYSNVIYLVGAAWLPWGLAAVDGWLRRGRRLALPALALVLALQALGGDPQAAYLTGLAALGLVGLLAWTERAPRGLAGRWLVLGLLGWLVLSVLIAGLLPTLRGLGQRWPAGLPAGRTLWALAVLGGGAVVLGQGCRRGTPSSRKLLGLVGAGVLALGLGAVQVLPIAEFARASSRGDDQATAFDIYGFSLRPVRLAEWLWPGVFGAYYPQNDAWIRLLPPADDPTFWTPSVYAGALTLVLALAAGLGRSDERRPERTWLMLLLLVAVLASFGRYGGPVGLTRWVPGLSQWAPGPDAAPTRVQADFRDGDASAYWWLATFVPGFDRFRFPSKLLTFSTVALAALAGLGWDQLARSKRVGTVVTIALALAGLGLLLLLGVTVFQGSIVAAWQAAPRSASGETGPFRPEAAFGHLRRGLLHGTVVLALAAALIRLAPRRPTLAGVLAVGLTTLDLAIASAPLVWTVPQAVFNAESRVLTAIQAEEARNPAPGGPFRIHRFPVWSPFRHFQTGDPGRLPAIVAWERDTLQPLHGLPLDVSYTLTLGILENARYLRQFLPSVRPIGPGLAGTTGLAPTDRVLYFPRRAFDLWTTRYFVMPVEPMGWRQENRAYAAFLDRVTLVAPPLEQFASPDERAAWRTDQDWQIFRNQNAFPRAWIVHEARVVPPFESLDAAEQDARLRQLLYQADPIWNEPGRPVLDLRRTALVESDPPSALKLGLRTPASEASESVTVERHEPGRVELKATLTAPGLVILADTDAPGWSLTIDGQPAEILRTNHLMRAARVEHGTHTLVYRYEPASFRVGAVVSLGAVVVLLGWIGSVRWRPPSAAV